MIVGVKAWELQLAGCQSLKGADETVSIHPDRREEPGPIGAILDDC